MNAHITRWERFQVHAMAPVLWGSFILALISTGYLAAMTVNDRRSR